MLRVYLGENALTRDSACKEYIDSFIKEHGQMAVDTLSVDSLSVNDCIDAVTTVPFLSAKRCVVLKYVSQNKDLADNFSKIIQRSASSTEIVVVESSLDSRLTYSKYIKKQANDLQVFDVLDGPSLARWVVKSAQDQGATIDTKTAQLLIDMVGPNQLLVASELNKLSLASNVISKELVKSLVEASPQSNVFAMLDAVVQSDTSLVVKLYKEQRDQGVEPLAIMGMVSWQLYILSVIAAHKNESPDFIAKQAKISPYVVRKNYSIAKKMSKSQIIALLDVAISADYSIKTNQSKPDGAVLILLLELSQKLNNSQ